MFGRKYVKTTMRMLTILREEEEWTRVHLREASLLFASAITKSSLYLRQNDEAHAHQITLLSLAPIWEPFSSWTSEANPTLGCSIEISRDIYIYK